MNSAMAGSDEKGLRGDIARLFSERGLHEGRPTVPRAIQRVVTRPGPLAIVLYRLSHALWERGLETLAEVIWRVNYFLSGADIHPGAEIGGGLRLTHTTGLVIGRGVRIGSNVTLLHGVTLAGSARGWFDDAPSSRALRGAGRRWRHAGPNPCLSRSRGSCGEAPARLPPSLEPKAPRSHRSTPSLTERRCSSVGRTARKSVPNRWLTCRIMS